MPLLWRATMLWCIIPWCWTCKELDSIPWCHTCIPSAVMSDVMPSPLVFLVAFLAVDIRLRICIDILLLLSDGTVITGSILLSRASAEILVDERQAQKTTIRTKKGSLHREKSLHEDKKYRKAPTWRKGPTHGEKGPHIEKKAPTWRKGWGKRLPHREKLPPHGEKGPQYDEKVAKTLPI